MLMMMMIMMMAMVVAMVMLLLMMIRMLMMILAVIVLTPLVAHASDLKRIVWPCFFFTFVFAIPSC